MGEVTERDLTTLSYLMSSLVASPNAAEKLVGFYLETLEVPPLQREVAGALRTALQEARARGAKPEDALRAAAVELLNSENSSLVTGGRLLVGAFENVGQNVPAATNVS